MTPQELLRAAAAEVQRRGLHKGSFAPSVPFGLLPDERTAWLADCPVCLLGAINVVMGGDPTRLPRGYHVNDDAGTFDLLRATHRAIFKVLGNPDCSLAYWSDLPETTADHVVLTLNAAADLLDAEAAA